MYVPLAATHVLRIRVHEGWVSLCRGFLIGDDFQADHSTPFTFPESKLPEVQEALWNLSAQAHHGRSSRHSPSEGGPKAAPGLDGPAAWQAEQGPEGA